MNFVCLSKLFSFAYLALLASFAAKCNLSSYLAIEIITNIKKIEDTISTDYEVLHPYEDIWTTD